MIVDFEFFDEDPIENVITSLNYRIDKTVFFSYVGIAEAQKSGLERFLKQICGVKEVEFCTVAENDLADIIEVMSDKVDEELGADNHLFFDLTGGESLPLVAFGMISKDLMAPMHMYDIHTNEMFEYGYDGVPLLSEVAEYDPISLNLDNYISLYGGMIDYRMQKDYKNAWNQEDAADIENLWKISRKYSAKWVNYCCLLRKFPADAQMVAQVEEALMLKEAQKMKTIGSTNAFKKFLKECEEAGLIQTLSNENGIRKFAYKNASIKNYFWDSGCILEMYTFLKESQHEIANDCRVGVHIDWDGVIHNGSGEDVLNEIDVMSMSNNLPTFISCKIGNVDQMALYELETVANRFGGRYAKKVLAVAKEVAPSLLLRAEEMGIEVRKME